MRKSIFIASIILNIILVAGITYKLHDNHQKYQLDEKLNVPTDSFTIGQTTVEEKEDYFIVKVEFKPSDEIKEFLGTGIFEEEYAYRFKLYAFTDNPSYVSDKQIIDLSKKDQIFTYHINKEELTTETITTLTAMANNTLEESGRFGVLSITSKNDVEFMDLEIFYDRIKVGE